MASASACGRGGQREAGSGSAKELRKLERELKGVQRDAQYRQRAFEAWRASVERLIAGRQAGIQRMDERLAAGLQDSARREAVSQRVSDLGTHVAAINEDVSAKESGLAVTEQRIAATAQQIEQRIALIERSRR